MRTGPIYSEDAMQEMRERIEALESALTDLIDSLPKCDQCTRPATRAWERGKGRYCDEDGLLVPDYPRAPALRKAIALLAKADEEAKNVETGR